VERDKIGEAGGYLLSLDSPVMATAHKRLRRTASFEPRLARMQRLDGLWRPGGVDDRRRKRPVRLLQAVVQSSQAF
jgi:hypothetical protein